MTQLHTPLLVGVMIVSWLSEGVKAAAHAPAPRNVLWLPLGDSITWGCTGPTIKDCHSDSAGYRIPLALALSQHPLGSPANVGFNLSTMGTLTTGPPYVPKQWLAHEGHPGWQINMVDGILNKSLATSVQPPDLVTIHLGTNDCNGGVSPADMVSRMNSLLLHLAAKAPTAQVFLGDVIATGNAWNSCILEYNKLVPGIVTTWAGHGMSIYYVPVYASMQPGCGAIGNETDLCGGHQIHPTSAGYPKMASAYALTILQHFK
mmetsp:Transcript_31162/g.81716  ORF Transcript_31162/g.81716 Transcript_31162/m.81716 type:complete len:261 (+) Transcript_31162:92-874(+)|eukprot:CAMPEP_0182927538 /NCGR_PEP_ID=MMETSP0105_2-20130417/13837_1 /TAXON_ID=81532 ORGANISM="Acanthoeca-like sp., Strain 10tr" /NCGR_SAMPLE_ID=MMETSP0105_2 /ASSEMBLY_ACC=CAM_ASM_000205 /LENGTH=260 /DNA_ID=CAMNT_0025065487 /DNA_START=62 /DNA_END=844 /DNA_ORIENTATION=-